VLLRYADFVKELANREHLNVADLNNPVVAALEKAKATDSDLAAKIIPDRVHPGPSGHLLMAGALLKSWNAPTLVTSVEIDAQAKRVVKADKTQLIDPTFEPVLSWTQMDEALPMPVDLNDPVVALAVRSSDFMQTLNQQPLKVTGLSAPRYTLKIGDTEVGTFTREQLAEGINLAAEATPMVEQARRVHDLTIKHNNLHFTRWRQIQVPMEGQTAPKTRRAVADLLDALDAEEAELVKDQRAALRIDAHTYALVPQP